MNIKRRCLQSAVLSLVLSTGGIQAATVNWGGAFFTTNYSADGTGLNIGPTATDPGGNVLFELGVFQNADGSEFTPTYANIDEWEDRWVPLDSVGNSSSSTYDVTASYFGDVATIGEAAGQITTVSSSATGGVLVHGFRAYIWGYDTKDLSGPEQPEWFLATGIDGTASGSTSNNWIVPDSSANNNGTLDIQWDIASASVAIVGRIDDNIGDGEMVDPLVPFEHSDHQFATVPEPSGVLLSLLAAGVVLIRRQR